MDLRDYDHAALDRPYPGVPRDPAQDAALRTPALMDAQEVQPYLAYYRGQELLVYAGTISGHVAWDYMDPNDIAAAAFYRQAALGKTYYGYAYIPTQDTADNIAQQAQAQAFLVDQFAIPSYDSYGGAQ